ncbi:core protein, partial [Cymbomonas tetramitiformis]
MSPASKNEGSTTVESTSGKWESTTIRLTESSTLPFLFLLLPQIWKNAVNLLEGNLTALSIICWQGFTNGLLGNLLLLSYFSAKKERSAAFVQVVGVLSTAALLTQ